jgi:DNA-binding transcriptional MerR regulator
MYSIGKFSKLTGISVDTLQSWDRRKLLIAHRTVTGRRFYKEEDREKAVSHPDKERK